MKTRTKALLLVMSALLLVVSTVFATMAYLTSKTDVVKNTFTVGKVAITLDEADVDEYGDLLYTDAEELAARVTENDYKLIPGHKYTKDPVIHVAVKSEKCYLFVKVVNNLSEIEAADTVATQMAAKGWALLDGEENVWYYTTTVDAREEAKDIPVFDYFTVKGDAAIETYAGKTITVEAYAVQADGFDSAAAAWGSAAAQWES